MFFKEHGQPHFHAEYQGFSAVYSIEEGVAIDGALPRKQNKIVQHWAKEHRDELSENWDMMKQKGAFKKIRGADR